MMPNRERFTGDRAVPHSVVAAFMIYAAAGVSQDSFEFAVLHRIISLSVRIIARVYTYVKTFFKKRGE